MAMIRCRECGRSISDEARTCPYCGCPSVKEQKMQDVRDGNTNGVKIARTSISVIIAIAISTAMVFVAISSVKREHQAAVDRFYESDTGKELDDLRSRVKENTQSAEDIIEDVKNIEVPAYLFD